MLEFMRDNYIYILLVTVLFIIVSTFVSVSDTQFYSEAPALHNTVVIERGIEINI